MLVLRKILRTYEMNDPFIYFVICFPATNIVLALKHSYLSLSVIGTQVCRMMMIVVITIKTKNVWYR